MAYKNMAQASLPVLPREQDRQESLPHDIMNAFIYIIIAANLIAFLQMAVDKRLAVKQKRRISEAQLIAPTLFGGFPGVLLGMILFRHKTVKKSFQFKLLLALILFIGGIYLYYRLV